MGRDWLLLEVLGDEPAVVAQGHALRKFVPIHTFLRRNPVRDAITTAVHTTIRTRAGLKITADGSNMLLTEPVMMNDGKIHGVHLWTGPIDEEPRSRPLPGAVIWDLTSGKASDTHQALENAGLDVEAQRTDNRPFAADLPIGSITPEQSAALTATMSCKPGDTFCSTWDLENYEGSPIRVSFVARAALEDTPGDGSHLVCRAMNWRVPINDVLPSNDDLANKILNSMAQQGIHRALIDLQSWALLKWIDTPCPHVDWRGDVAGQPMVHRDDRPIVRSMTEQFKRGPSAGLLRLRRPGGGWTLIHATAFRVQLLNDVYAGIVSLRLPTPAELRRFAT